MLRARLWNATGGALLWRAGLAGRVTTPGRISGQPRTIQCGYLARDDGSILVGSAQGRQWPENLAAAGTCTFETRDRPARTYSATELDGAARSAAIAEFRSARGDRAARMFSGRVFELRHDG